MARRSQRLSSGTLPYVAHKRNVSSSAIQGTELKKAKTVKTTPTKSQYFKHDDEKANGRDHVEDLSDDELSIGEDDVSAFDEENDDNISISDANEDEEYDEEDDVPASRSVSKKAKSTKATGIVAKASQLWREGVKTGLGPGKQVIIKKPKARPAGKVSYSDDTIHPNTLLFLADLKANNNREWLKMHDPDFRQSERDWFSFVEKLTEKLTEIDDSVPELPVKDIIFRVYRDVRFSSDPTPYKPFFSAAWSRTGRKGPYAHYYLQVAASASYMGGGLWHPEAASLAAMRRDIDRRPRRLKDVLLDENVRKSFLDGASKTDSKAVKAFIASNAEHALKTKPKGYEAQHPDIDLLRLKSFTIGRKLKDDELLGPAGLQRVADLFAALKPFIEYINGVVMPDAESSEEDEESSDVEEDENDNESNEDDDEVDEA